MFKFQTIQEWFPTSEKNSSFSKTETAGYKTLAQRIDMLNRGIMLNLDNSQYYDFDNDAYEQNANNFSDIRSPKDGYDITDMVEDISSIRHNHFIKSYHQNVENNEPMELNQKAQIGDLVETNSVENSDTN